MADILLKKSFMFNGVNYELEPCGVMCDAKVPVMEDANSCKACDAYVYASHGELYARIDDRDYDLIGQPTKISVSIIPIEGVKSMGGPVHVKRCRLVELYYDDSNRIACDEWTKKDGQAKSPSDSIIEVCDSIKNLLLEKNRKYGNSALNPCRVFSKADSVEQLKVRIDDKINRIKNEQNDEDEDVVKDLIGYLVLLVIARNNNAEAEKDNS